MSNFSDKAKAIIASLAPTIGTALGGPFGALAGTALATALGGGDDKATETAILSGNPELLAKIKIAEQDFQLKLKELGIDEEKLEYSDTDSARKREMTVQDWTPRLLAFLIVGLYIGVQWFLLSHSINQDMREIAMRSLGTLDASLGLVLGYYFGSSRSSAQKTALLDKLASK
jgi:hypothetical protein